jgi:ribonuclease III
MENEGEPSNERLEFLGDAVLGLIVADHSFRSYAELPQGDLTDVRKAVVNSNTLAEVAAELELGDALLLGKGEDRAGGRDKPSILADAMEAVIGAVYLDAGWDAAQAMVLRLLGDSIERAAAGPGGQDFKSRLQELSARLFAAAPSYDVSDDGPDHAKRFFATVVVEDHVEGRGEGRSKKQAEQAAARHAWEQLSDQVPDAASAVEEDTVAEDTVEEDPDA